MRLLILPKKICNWFLKKSTGKNWTGFSTSGCMIHRQSITRGSQTLIWDRLPMTIMFMGMFTSIIGELVDARAANRMLVPMLIAGAGSVFWWSWTESLGVGDLRPYAIVQFVPPMLILFMLLAYPAPRHYVSFIVGIILLYGLAKICEAFDGRIYDSLRGVSGHTLKHWISALASGCMLMMLIRRSRSQTAQE